MGQYCNIGPRRRISSHPTYGSRDSAHAQWPRTHFNGNQWETLLLITQERIGVGASNLVQIIDVGVDACGILFRSVGSRNMADIQHIKCNNQRKTSPNRRIFALYKEIGVGELNGGV